MKAVILAGGKGTRLGDLTKEIPKPMVRLAGKPLLEYHIELLKRYGVTDILITVNYLKDSILSYFGNGGKWGVRIRYYEEAEPLGTVGGIKALEADLQENFLVIYGDVMINMHLGKLMEFHREHAAVATLVLHPNDHPYDSDLVDMNKDAIITGFYPKPHAGGYYRNLVNAGLYVFSPAIFAHLESGKKADFGADIFPAICDKVRMAGYNTSEYLKDMGTPDRLEKVTADLVSGKIEKASYEHRQQAVFLDRDGVLNDDTEFIHRAEDLHLYPFTPAAVKKINDSGMLSVVVTNQSVVARNLCTVEGLQEIHNKMETDLGKERAKLDAIYYCPHHPDRGFPEENLEYKTDCECRKPKPGMLRDAARDFNIDLERSYMIGDNERDIEAGRAAGCTTIGVATGKGVKRTAVLPDYFFADLQEAVDFIVDEPYRELAEELLLKASGSEGKPYVIAIGGNTQSGKSTLATYLKKYFERKGTRTLKIELDDWILSYEKRSPDFTVFENFQAPKIVSDLGKILRGGSIEAAGYSRHPERKAIPRTYRYTDEPVVIIEGVIALSVEKIRDMADVRLFRSIGDEELREKVLRYYQWKNYSPEEAAALFAKRRDGEYAQITASSVHADRIV